MSFPIPEGSKSPHRSRGIFERFISPNSRQRSASNVGTSPSMVIPSSGKEMRLIPRSPRYRVDRSLVDYDLLSPSPSPSFSGLPSPNFDSLALSPQRSQSHGFAASYHEQTDADRMRRGSRRSRNTPGSPLPSRHTRKGSEAAVQLRSFRPGFEEDDRSTLHLEVERISLELQQIERFLDLLPSMLENEEGRKHIASIEQQMNLFFLSFEETQKNIRGLLEELLEAADAARGENLVLITQRMSAIQEHYTQTKQKYGLDHLNEEDNSARQLASQLSDLELRKLLEESRVTFPSTLHKPELEDLVVVNRLLSQVEDDDDTDSDELLEEWDEGQECSICLETHRSKNFYTLRCGHGFCKYCQRGFINSRIGDGDVQGMCCPNTGCDEPYMAEDIANLVPASTANRYDQLLVLGELKNNPNCRWCPRPGCNTAMIADPADKSLSCTQCGQGICFPCKQMSHGPKTCEEYAEWRKENDENEKDWEDWAKSNGAKQCPKCGVFIVRTTGCNQVICQSCQWSFCWLCLKECIVPDHYKFGECEGKWFEDTTLTTSQKIMAGILLGGVILLASPLLALAGTVAIGRRLRRKVARRKEPELSDEESSQSDLE